MEVFHSPYHLRKITYDKILKILFNKTFLGKLKTKEEFYPLEFDEQHDEHGTLELSLLIRPFEGEITVGVENKIIFKMYRTNKYMIKS